MRRFFAHSLVEGKDPLLEYILEILNLKKIEHELAGDNITDIDCQKLTTAELAIGTYSVMLYDQPLSGSDPVTTYDLVDTIRTIIRIQQSSAIMSLNQQSQEVFDLFDRVILLRDGHVLYQGPYQDAILYFAKLGYIKPPHVESGEFLEDIASGVRTRYLAPQSMPLSIVDFVRSYQLSDHYHDVLRVVEGEVITIMYWIESEPGIGLSLKIPTKFNSAISLVSRQDVELVVTKISSKVADSRGIESTGRVQLGDVVTGISINNEDLQYLAVGPTDTQKECRSQVYSMIRNAQGHIHLQVERNQDEMSYLEEWSHIDRDHFSSLSGAIEALKASTLRLPVGEAKID